MFLEIVYKTTAKLLEFDDDEIKNGTSFITKGRP